MQTWSKAKALAALAVLTSARAVSATPALKLPASPGYRGSDVCPQRCTDAGTNPANWTAYHSLDQFDGCPLVLFEAFSLYDNVDDASRTHGIYACSSYGPDFANLPDADSRHQPETAETINNATFEVGWWNDQVGKSAAADIRSVAKQLRQYLASGYGSSNDTETLYARSGLAAAGIYLGSGLKHDGVSADALKILEDNLAMLNTSSPSVAMQFCQPDYTSEHIFGFFATSNKSFAPIQQAMQSWSDATCLSFPNSQNFTSKVKVTTPIVITSASNSTLGGSNSTSNTVKLYSRATVHARSQCSTVQVKSGDSCGSLASKCGISGAAFTKYNDDRGFCSSLSPGQHVCCSSGDLPDFKPKPNHDGSCHSYYVPRGDNCAKIAATNSLTLDDLEDFNKNTWAWNGCENLQFNMNICLSKGDPPMPATVANAICGPQVPDTQKPSDGTDLADLNPCPLNACCDIWGQCGITAEFCTKSGNGNPGTAKSGTNGCISNCGTTIRRGDAPSTFRKIGYFEGYGLKRDCLFQDARQIDTSKYTHLHFGFGTLTPDYEVSVGDSLSTYEFESFKRVRGAARILSFGGWAFSTDPATYNIFREGVTPANRLKMAHSIADFIKKHDLDGVDIDWEYPGAPDIPGIPPGGKDDGENYFVFLVILKNLLHGKSVSIAAPSSYWYLRAYPIKKIAQVVDYIVYMTYDLHGQWDAQNPNSQEGCANGNCLRSQVNLTETISSLVMITKAEVPSSKVVVGVTSYGRSFNMAQPGCSGPDCFYTGTRFQSDATKGVCTNTAGYIANAEIRDILKDSSRVTKHFVDGQSDSNILIYDDTQWVAYMDDDVKAHRSQIYSRLNMGGTTDWATDLDNYNDVPNPTMSWLQFRLSCKAGGDPYVEGPRSGNWTELSCDSRAFQDIRHLSPAERWDQLDCTDAWADAISHWKDTDRGKTDIGFSNSVSDVFGGPRHVDCGILLETSNCDQTFPCGSFGGAGTGPAASVIFNSFVLIHEAYKSFSVALTNAAAKVIDPALDHFENEFSPVPPKDDQTWLLLLLDFVTVGASAVAAPFFNQVLSKLPKWADGGAGDNLKDATMLFIGQSTTIGKDLLSAEDGKWSSADQDKFSDYLGQAIEKWSNITDVALHRLFDGHDDEIDDLYAIISNGQLMAGNGAEIPSEPGVSLTDFENDIAKAFFAYAIPTAWTFSKHYAFVVDSGYPCDAQDPLGDYIDADVMHATYHCVGPTLYYLVAAKGQSKDCHYKCEHRTNCDYVCTDNHFPPPPGLGSLDKSNFGGVTVGDLIEGSVNTYIANGKENGGKFVDVADESSFRDLMDNKVTTAGYIRLPVCSPERAFKTWDTGDPDDDPNYPCNIPKGVDDCGDSTFVDQTSGASPPVEDCKQIIKNIQDDGTTSFNPPSVGQHEILHYGECKFGVETTGVDTINVGGQDVIDIINDAIDRFGGGGKIGAKGVMKCHANIHDTKVEWGIY